MKYRVVLSRGAERAFSHLNPIDYLAVSKVIRSLEEEPWPASAGSVRLRKKSLPNLYRIRVRDYRVIYSVETKNSTIYVERIARRSEKTYRGL